MGRKKKGDELLDLPDADEGVAEAEEEAPAKVGVRRAGAAVGCPIPL